MSKKPVNLTPAILQPEPETVDLSDFFEPTFVPLPEIEPENLDGDSSSGQGLSKVEPRAEPRESSLLLSKPNSEINNPILHPVTERPQSEPFNAELSDAQVEVGSPALGPPFTGQLTIPGLPADESRVFTGSLLAEALDADEDDREQAAFDAEDDRLDLERLGVDFCNLLSSLASAARVPRSLILRDFLELATRIFQSGLVSQESRADVFLTLGEVLSMLGAARTLARASRSLTNVPVEDLARAFGHWCRLPSEQPPPVRREPAPKAPPSPKASAPKPPAPKPALAKPPSGSKATPIPGPSVKAAAAKKKADAKIAADKLKALKKLQADSAREMAKLEKELKK